MCGAGSTRPALPSVHSAPPSVPSVSQRQAGGLADVSGEEPPGRRSGPSSQDRILGVYCLSRQRARTAPRHPHLHHQLEQTSPPVRLDQIPDEILKKANCQPTSNHAPLERLQSMCNCFPVPRNVVISRVLLIMVPLLFAEKTRHRCPLPGGSAILSRPVSEKVVVFTPATSLCEFNR